MDRQGDQERIVCLDCAEGKENWSFRYPVDFGRFQYNAGPRATPTVVGRHLYAVGATGTFVALELPIEPKGQPRELWRHDLIQEFDAPLATWGMACSPAVEGDLVIVQPGGSKGSIAAFNRITGQLVWAALDDVNGYSSPVIADFSGERQVVAFTGEGVVGLSLQDGAKRWYFDWPEQFHGNIATPIIAGNLVFISSAYDNGGCALLEIVQEGGSWDARLVYKKRGKLMANHHATCVLHDGHLYGFDKSLFKCVDLRTGTEKWVSRKPEKGSLLFADGHLIILSERGDLALAEASPHQCNLKGTVAVFDRGETWAMPVLSRKRLYVRDKEEIVCLDLSKPAAQ
jgi:outer membrane protein assembly factor BamB